MKMTTQIYAKYNLMVLSRIQHYERVYKLPQGVLNGIGYELFYKAVKTYNPEKSSLSTHIYITLLNLNAAGKKERDFRNVHAFELFIDVIPCIDFNFEKVDLLQSIALELSNEAQCLLKDLFFGIFSEPRSSNGGRPTTYPISAICSRYNWTPQKARSIRNEISAWWKNY